MLSVLAGCAFERYPEPGPGQARHGQPSDAVAVPLPTDGGRLGDIAERYQARPVAALSRRYDAGQVELARDAAPDAAEAYGGRQDCFDEPLGDGGPGGASTPCVGGQAACVLDGPSGIHYCASRDPLVSPPEPSGGCCSDDDCGGEASGYACLRWDRHGGACVRRCRP